MASIHNKIQTTDGKKAPKSGKTQYVFKPASEMPPIKLDYVVQSPTPLGQKVPPAANKRK